MDARRDGLLGFVRTAVAALTLGAASFANAAAPIDVTWTPSAAGLPAAAFTFDNVILDTYSTLTFGGGGTTFHEEGFLNLGTFKNGATITQIPNIGVTSGTAYSLYLAFTADGVQSPGVPSTGHFTNLTYTLYGATGATQFLDTNADNLFEAVGGAGTTLATGALIGTGATSLTLDPVAGVTASAQILASFIPSVAGFSSPAGALTINAAFTNTPSVRTEIPGGFIVTGGGGNATLAVAPVPEPQTYLMLIAGLGLMGFVARRRANRDAA